MDTIVFQSGQFPACRASGGTSDHSPSSGWSLAYSVHTSGILASISKPAPPPPHVMDETLPALLHTHTHTASAPLG